MTSETPKSANQPEGSTRIFLRVVTGDNCPSFKNTKRAGINSSTGKAGNFTPKATKKRMAQLENRIVSSLYSLCQTPEHATDSECLKQLRTALSGLSDDSLTEIPKFSFDVRYVEPGLEGVEITIEKL